jgi:hypothetical protein
MGGGDRRRTLTEPNVDRALEIIVQDLAQYNVVLSPDKIERLRKVLQLPAPPPPPATKASYKPGVKRGPKKRP